MKNWEVVLWEDVLTIKNGRNQKKVENINGSYPIYGSGGVMGFADDFLCEEGTTIIGRKGSINNPIFVNTKFWNVDTAFGLCPGERLHNKFFYYFCTTYNFLKHNKATTLPSLTKADLLKIQIPLPPLDTQRKIAAILDAADAYRQKTKGLIDKYDQLAQSLFLEMFGDPVKNEKGWEKVELTNLVTKLGDGIHGTPKYSDNGDYFFINGNNLDNGSITITPNTKKVSEDEFKIHKKDIDATTMFVSINGTIGKAAFYKGEKIILGKSACYFNVKTEIINQIYLYNIITSAYFLKFATNNATGSTIQNVSLKTMRSFPVPLAPLPLQTLFAERIALIETQKQQAQASLQKAEDLFNSLLQRAFKGELA
jgi:type I restriction enzyme, S subunit